MILRGFYTHPHTHSYRQTQRGLSQWTGNALGTGISVMVLLAPFTHICGHS